VSIGTLTPRTATPYTAKVTAAAASPLPAGARIGFYQSIDAQDAPYVIESSPIDPFNQNLFNAQSLSTGTVDSGTWSTSGGAISVVSAQPTQGAGNYWVAASAPFYTDGSLSDQTRVTSRVPAAVVPELSLVSGAVPGSLTVNIQTTAGKYDQGELLVSHDGALVASLSLNNVLSQGGGTVAFSALPAGTPTSLYYLSVRVWKNGANPTATRQWYPNAIDMRSNLSGLLPLTIN
jgi:hypothetical protein